MLTLAIQRHYTFNFVFNERLDPILHFCFYFYFNVVQADQHKLNFKYKSPFPFTNVNVFQNATRPPKYRPESKKSKESKDQISRFI